MKKEQAITADQVLPPEKNTAESKGTSCPFSPGNSATMSKGSLCAFLQDVATQLKTEFEAYHKNENEAVGRAIRIGMLLLRVKEKVKHGEFRPWLAANIPEYSRRHCDRFRKLAEVFISKQQLDRAEAFALCAHTDKTHTAKFEQLVFDFTGGKSQADLFDENKILLREQKQIGGAHALNAWLRENGHADLCGTCERKLPANVRAEWKKHCKEKAAIHKLFEPEAIAAEYRILITKLADEILTKKTYCHLEREQLEHTYGILKQCVKEIQGGMK